MDMNVENKVLNKVTKNIVDKFSESQEELIKELNLIGDELSKITHETFKADRIVEIISKLSSINGEYITASATKVTIDLVYKALLMDNNLSDK